MAPKKKNVIQSPNAMSHVKVTTFVLLDFPYIIALSLELPVQKIEIILP